MVRAWLGVGISFMISLGLGCVKEQPAAVELKPGEGVERAKVILQQYAEGVPMGSEAMRFEQIVESVRKTDPQKAAILEKGFADIKRAPANRSAKAQELLKQL